MADKKKTVIVGPTGKRPSAKVNTTTTKKTNNTPPTNNKKKKKSSGGSSNSVSAAEKRAVARENAAKKAAGKRFLEGAKNLNAQAKAIRQALDIDFASNRDSKLASITNALKQQSDLLLSGSKQRAATFLDAATNTEKATADTAEEGLGNLVRERQDTMSSLLEQGAGETDTLRAMLMAARNWHANASEANRSYFDSMQSINSGITDLNVDTRTALAQAYGGAESDRESVWQDYYNKRGESFTQLGNVLGQQADYYAQAKEMGVKPKKGVEKAAEKAMAKAFADSAIEAGKSYAHQGLPTWVSNYQGQQQLQAKQSNTDLAAAVKMEKQAKAEGATLRKWDAA